MEVSDGAAAATPPGVRHAHTLTPVTSIGTASGEGASTESHAAAASLPKMKVPVLGAKKGVDFAANESANQVTLAFADVKTEVIEHGQNHDRCLERRREGRCGEREGLEGPPGRGGLRGGRLRRSCGRHAKGWRVSCYYIGPKFSSASWQLGPARAMASRRRFRCGL